MQSDQFQRLPPETLTEITRYLPPVEAAKLRLVNRRARYTIDTDPKAYEGLGTVSSQQIVTLSRRLDATTPAGAFKAFLRHATPENLTDEWSRAEVLAAVARHGNDAQRRTILGLATPRNFPDPAIRQSLRTNAMPRTGVKQRQDLSLSR